LIVLTVLASIVNGYLVGVFAKTKTG
jgi:uncharacterized membrane protein SpoIIM required for sporulation